MTYTNCLDDRDIRLPGSVAVRSQTFYKPKGTLN